MDVGADFSAQVRHYRATRGTLRLRGRSKFVLTNDHLCDVTATIDNDASGTFSNPGGTCLDNQRNTFILRGPNPSATFTTEGRTIVFKGPGTVIKKGYVRRGNRVHLRRGRVLPGQSPGELFVTGDLGFEDESSLEIEIGGRAAGTQYDRLSVDGSVLLEDVSLNAMVLPGFTDIAPADSFMVLTSTALSGMFSNAPPDSTVMTSDNLYSFVLRYGATSPFNPNHVVLTNLQFVPESGLAGILLTGGWLGARRRRTPARIALAEAGGGG